MKKLEMLGYFWIFTSISLCIGLYKLELSKRVIDEEYEYIKKHNEFVSRFGGAWGFFVLLIMCTGFFQKRDSLYYKRGIIAIVSILFGVVGSAYAFKDIFFK